MKRTLSVLLILLCSIYAFSTEYYFSTTGSDSNNGTTPQSAFGSLDKIKDLKLKPGDKLLLKRGDVFIGTIEFYSISGTEQNPIIITAYGAGNNKPIINAEGKLNGIFLEDCSHINVSDIEITANGGGLENYDASEKYMRCGVFITTKNAGTYTGITIDNIHVRDVFFENEGFNRGTGEVLTPNGVQNYGWGIRIINQNAKAILNHIVVRNCLVENVAHSGIRFTGRYQEGENSRNIKNIRILNNKVLRAGGPAMQASSCEDVIFRANLTNSSGSNDDTRKWGRGSGLWVWGCLDVLIEHNSFRNANGPGDSAGCHIDFNNKNVVIQYNLSENNVGGFVEILGNNHNCTYRYNVSINDGSRTWIKNKTLGAGTMIGVNGWVGRNRPRLGPFNIYIYNNTIFVKKDISPEVGVSRHTRGILVANNIFYLEGKAVYDHREPFLPENGSVPNVVCRNNLFLKADNWPKKELVMINDEKPIFGNPQFKNKGGQNIEDYIPQNTELVKNRGIEIESIPNDTIGLIGGFNLDKDILGNIISGKPDLGAIEIK